MTFDKAKWAYLTKKYPERAGRAYELYVADPKKTANPVTYFKFAGLLEKQDEVRYQKGLSKYQKKTKAIMELKT